MTTKTTKPTEAPPSRPMTLEELEADRAHRAAHARAVAEQESVTTEEIITLAFKLAKPVGMRDVHGAVSSGALVPHAKRSHGGGYLFDRDAAKAWILGRS